MCHSCANLATQAPDADVPMAEAIPSAEATSDSAWANVQHLPGGGQAMEAELAEAARLRESNEAALQQQRIANAQKLELGKSSLATAVALEPRHQVITSPSLRPPPAQSSASGAEAPSPRATPAKRPKEEEATPLTVTCDVCNPNFDGI